MTLPDVSAEGLGIETLKATYSAANCGTWSMLVMSKTAAFALLSPCLPTKASSLSFLRPTAVTLTPSSINRSAIPLPMPAVAPIKRTCLYGNTIVGNSFESGKYDLIEFFEKANGRVEFYTVSL